MSLPRRRELIIAALEVDQSYDAAEARTIERLISKLREYGVWRARLRDFLHDQCDCSRCARIREATR